MSKLAWTRPLVLVGTLAALTGAQAQGAEGPKAETTRPAPSLEIPYELYELDNGLEVILHHDATLPLVAVSVWYHVGGVDEPAGRTGFAHLFEHMMFQGSAHVGDDQHFKILEEIGATGVNGTTSFDRTNYFETVPSNHLETGLWLEADRMGFLLTTLTQERLDVQKDVVKNERRQGVETQPYGLADEKLWQTLFPLPHPYHGRVIGSMADLEAASLEDVKTFFETWYAPSNATLAIAGDFDPATIRDLVQRYFGSLPRRPEPQHPKVEDVKLTSQVVLRHDEEIATLPKVTLAWHTPTFFSPGDAEADVLATILTGGKSSRLERRLIRELELAQSVSAFQYSLGAQSVFFVEAVARPGVDPQRLREEIDAVLAGLAKTPPSRDEVERAVNRFETQYVSGIQMLGSFNGRAEQLQRYNHYRGNPGFIEEDLARYRAVTPETVSAFVREWLPAERRAVLIAVPTEKSPESAPAAAVEVK